MAVTETVWEMDSHTLGKHRILKAYLDAWFPILGHTQHKKILFVDGFSGPGEYKGGEPGSPLIALDCVRKAKERGLVDNTEVIMYFIEEDKERADHLQLLLEKEVIDSSIKINVYHSTFEEVMNRILKLDPGYVLVPAFIMVDPFGPKGLPLELIDRLMANPSCEVFISLMYEPIRRFHSLDEYQPHMTALFGDESWKSVSINSQDINNLLELYETKLRTTKAKHVLRYDLYKSSSKFMYSVFFATTVLLGCDRMKFAIWKTSSDGTFAFIGDAIHQKNLLLAGTDEFWKDLVDHFGGKEVNISTVKKFAQSDKTRFHLGQLKNKTLKPNQDKLVVTRPKGKKNGFPDGTKIKFPTQY